jgi:hypothetical protein
LNKKAKSKKQCENAVGFTGEGKKHTVPDYSVCKYQKVAGFFRKAIKTEPFDKMDKSNPHYGKTT